MEIKKLYLFYLFCLFLSFAKASWKMSNVKLIEYKLRIITSEADYKDSDTSLGFRGMVSISLKLNEPIKNEAFEINLNIDEKTEIFQIQVFDEGNNDFSNSFSHKMNSSHLSIITHDQMTFNSEVLIKITFRNLYGDDLYGLYRSSYVNENNEKRWLLTTQLEPTFARRIFPNFDNPLWKAKFTLEVEIPISLENYEVLCNTIAQKIDSEGKILFTCSPTALPMSSHLLAFTVSDFKCTSRETFNSSYPTELERFIQTCGRDEFIRNKDGALSQETVKEVVEFLAKYLNIGYGFEKIHQVGIPDFSAGAMENWGHISYREERLFFNDKKDSTLTKQNIVLVIAHELVHQWFGNLVTLESWDYIWLNEAFATYLSYKVAAELKEPKTDKWDYDKQFIVNEIHLKAFEEDGFPSSTPMTNQNLNEKFAFSYFNHIAYAKGSAILRMWEESLGKEKFQESLKEYINKNKLGTVNPSLLYNTFKKHGGMNEVFFNCWHEQPGYPVVEVKKLDKNDYSLTQHRFLWEMSDKNFTTLWYIPISYFTKDSPEKVIVEKMDKEEIKLENISSEWFIINNKQTGYYRVNYEKDHWEALGKALKSEDFGKINEYNRAQIVNDIFSLARSVYKNYVDYKTALSLTEFLKNEKSLIVWQTALDSFKFIQIKLTGHNEMLEKFRSHILNLITPHFKSLEENPELSHTEKLLSSQINQWACSLDFKNCTEEAEKIYKENKIPPDSLETILCTVIRIDNKYWNEIFEKYKKESKTSRKTMYLSALGCTDDTTTAESFLNKTLEPSSEIRQNERLLVFSSVCKKNINNIEVAFKFIENNYEAIAKTYGGINVLGKALATLAERLQNKKDIGRFNRLGEQVKGLVSQDYIKNAMLTLSSNVKWSDEKLSQIEDYLNSGSYLTISLSFSLFSLCSLIVYNL